MDWKNIRVYNGSQNNAFEELVCQLARKEKREQNKKFIKVGAPDSGIECCWVLESGDEIAWQAKYVFDIDNTLKEASSSFTTALKGHSRMVEFILAIPFDLPDPTYNRNGKPIKSAKKKWDDKVVAWKKEASDKGMNVEVTLWDSSALMERLCRQENEGTQYFWFHENECTREWFNMNLDNAISDLGPRYSPQINIELEVSKKFDYLRRNEKVKQSILRYQSRFRRVGNIFAEKFLVEKYNAQSNIEEFKDIQNAVDELLAFETYSEMNILPLSEIADYLNKLFDIVDGVMELVRENIAIDKYYNSSEYKVYSEVEGILTEGIQLFESDLELLNKPVMLLFGAAGTGKSHLLADICCKLRNASRQSILLLGEQFTNSVNPREQIKQLLQCNLNFDKLLQILNSIGQANQERVLFMVDALNEGDGNLIWPIYLNGILDEIYKYPWVACVVSVRTENMEEILPKGCTNKIVEVRHDGFDDVVDDACDKFFEYYDISLEVPLLVEEFSNPLYLKLFCESYTKKKIQMIPSITEVFTEYVDFVNKKLCSSRLYNYDESINLVQLCIDTISNKMNQGDKYSLPYVEAVLRVNEVITPFCQLSIVQYKNFLDALIKENIFKSYRVYGEKAKNITFSYERMGEFFLVNNKLKNKNKEISFKEFICNDNFFKVLFEKHSFRYKNKAMMLSILLPELYGVELLECTDDGKVPFFMVESFLQSLVWRKNRDVDAKIIKWLEYNAKKDSAFKILLVDNIMNMCSLPDSPLNMLFLHDKFLMKEKSGIRDSWWTIHINECYENRRPRIYRKIIRWSWKPENKRQINKESRELLGITLLWFCTSNDRELRDTATKGLVCLYKDNVDEIIALYERFQSVNDLYVLERLYAAAYGAVMYCKELKKIRVVSDYILNHFFGGTSVLAYIPIRDYAREIVEYAISKKVYHEKVDEIIELIMPPYKSKFPKRFPSNKSIEEMETTYKDDSGFLHVMSSMRMDMGYGDFGRYIFERAFKDFAEIDIEKLNRWVIKRIIQLGFDPKIHDKTLPGYFGRRGGKTERIGKKYQWIAFYEILALVADHYMLNPEYGELENKACNCEWYVKFRNIDPSLSIYQSKIVNYKQPEQSWTSDFAYLPLEENNISWLSEKPDFIEKLLNFKDADEHEWMSLCYFPFWNEYKEEKEKWNDESKKTMRGYVNSYIVKKSDLEKIKTLYEQEHQKFRDGFEVDNYNGLFLRDFFWSKAYEEYGEDSKNDVWRRLSIGEQETDIVYAMSSLRYIWEEEYDFAKEDAIAFDIPGKIIVDGMGLEYQIVPGQYFKEDNLVCFIPGINQESNQLLLIDKKCFMQWLQDNNYCALWIITIEKRMAYELRRTKWSKWDGLYVLCDLELSGEIELVENS